MVETILAEEASKRFSTFDFRKTQLYPSLKSSDLRLDLSLKPENIFDSVQIQRHSLHDIGLTPGDPMSVAQAHHWINTHFRAIHHNTPFLNLTEILETATRVFESPLSSSPGHDYLALLYSILALGSLREQTYDSATGKYRPFRTAQTLNDGTSPASTRSMSTPKSRSTTQCLFRMAQDELDQIDDPSEIAVQALFLVHTFVSSTSMGRRSRDYVARAVMMAHELGLNRRIPHDLHLKGKYDKHGVRRRAMIYLYVLFSDV